MGCIAIKIVGGQVAEVISTFENPDVYVMDLDRGEEAPQEFNSDNVIQSRNPPALMIERHQHPEEETV